MEEGSSLENQTQTDNRVTPLEAGLVILVTFFITAFGGAIVLLAFGYGTAGNTLAYGASGVVGELLILIVPLIYFLLKRINIKKYIGLDLNPKYILIGLAAGAILFLLNIIVSTALSYVVNNQLVEQTNADILNASSTTPGLILVAASLLLAGICEEFAFRGFLQNALTRRFSFVPAVLISAAVFGIFHLDPQGFYIIAAFISGLVLGYIYHRTNYVTSATAHATMNIIVLTFLILGI
jgi:membrane protease YdiL (CAAX protease family)